MVELKRSVKMCGIGTNRRTRLMSWALLSAAGLATLITCLPWSLLAQDGTASLSGVLQDPTGAAIGGYWNAIGEYAASVTLEAAGGGFRQMTHPDQQGRFHFSGLPAGTYTVSTRSPYFDSLKIEQTLLAGEETSWPPVRLVQAGSGCSFSQKIDPVSTRFLAAGPAFGALAGNIHDGQQPTANVRVTLACWRGRGCPDDPEPTRTDLQGDFEFKNVRPGRYVLIIEQQRFFPRVDDFVVAGGLESSYSLNLTPCPNGDCRVKPSMTSTEPGAAKITVCE